MRKLLISLATIGAMTAAVPLAQAKPGGCLKYGAAGAVAGHAMGHGVRGFMAGCAAGMYRRHLYNKQQRQLQQTAPVNG